MKLSTIMNIEISSVCNESCRYCPAKDIHKARKPGFMTMDTFNACMAYIQKYIERGTQTEVNLFGVGEPTLNPLLPDMIKVARSVMPMRLPVHTNTNGAWIDTNTTETTEKELAYIKTLKDAGISHIDVTAHNYFKTAKAIRILKAVGIPGSVSFDPVIHPNTWAGQVDWFTPDYNAGPCPWLNRGQAFILHNGDIVHCCIDAYGTGVLGNVNDEFKEIEIKPFELCKSCHHTI